MLLRAHQGLDQAMDTGRDTAKATCQYLEWDKVMDMD